MEYDAHPVGPIVFNAAPIYPMAAAAEILPKWVAWTRTAPEEATSRALFWTFPDVDALPPELRGQDALILAALHSGSPDEGERVLQPLREMGALLFDLSMALPYRAAQSNFDPFFAKGVTRSYWKSLYLDDLDDAACDLIVRRAMARPHPLTLVHVPQMGGATSRIAADESGVRRPQRGVHAQRRRQLDRRGRRRRAPSGGRAASSPRPRSSRRRGAST